MCCNDRKYSCLFLFTPWKTLQLTRTRGRSESRSLIESGCVSLCGFAYEMTRFCLAECLHGFVHSWVLQWSQRSRRLSVITVCLFSVMWVEKCSDLIWDGLNWQTLWKSVWANSWEHLRAFEDFQVSWFQGFLGWVLGTFKALDVFDVLLVSLFFPEIVLRVLRPFKCKPHW